MHTFTVTSKNPCFFHKTHHQITIPNRYRLDFDQWSIGLGHIQTKLPTLTAEEREILLTGTCDEGWESMFKEEDR
jgi:hypothetical protein